MGFPMFFPIEKLDGLGKTIEKCGKHQGENHWGTPLEMEDHST